MGERRGPYAPGVPLPPVKTAAPELPATLIARRRLYSALDAGASRPVTLVCAPTGYGKTMLLASWIRQSARPAAWVCLDGDDNDPRRLLSAVLTALHTGEPPGAPSALVLDGVDELTDPAALRSLELLLRHQPAQLRLVLAARYDPPLALHRLRVAGRLHEIRADALQFTAEEAAALLEQHGLALAPRDLALLMRRTEGWPAGLRLAAMSMQSAADPAAFLAEFDGDESCVADYLAGEVLSRRPPGEREFMLATSVCERLSIDLADTLTGRDDAAAVLDALHRGGALTSRLGPSHLSHRSGSAWYRYHGLLRGYLHAELRRRDPAAIPGLHRRAADWFEAHQLPAEAVRHAVAVPDVPRAAALLDRHGTSLLMSGQGGTLRRLLRGLPGPALESDPRLLPLAALAWLDAGDAVSGGRYLALSDRAGPEPGDPRLRALRAVARLHRTRLGGDLAAALRFAERIPLPAPDGADPTAQFLTAQIQADRGTLHLQLGHRTQGRADLESALATATRQRLDRLAVHCMSCLAAVAAGDCDFARAVRLGEAAADLAEPHGWAHSAVCAPAYEALAWAKYQQLDAAAARHFSLLAEQAVRGQTDPALDFGARVLAAVTAFEQGARRSGLLDLRRAWESCGDRQPMPELTALGCLAEAEMALAAGEHLWAVEAVERARRLLRGSAETAVLEAALLRAKGRGTAARRSLRPALDGAAVPVVATTLIQAWLLEAGLSAAQGEHPRAAHALREALTLSEPRRALRPFRAAGPAVRHLLTHCLPGLGPLEPFATDLLHAIPGGGGGETPAEPLTPRETALLRQLPSLQTLDEIAAGLFISVNTLKTHVRSIYRKLQVGSRREAVAAARERGLI